MTLDSWGDLAALARPSRVYRGQASATWDLSTSLERCFLRHQVEPAARRGVKGDLLREFRRAYHQYSRHVPVTEDRLEWLSLMQHHGAPTRLLDFTYSLHVATYFALEDAAADAAIWAIDFQWAVSESAERLRDVGVPEDRLVVLNSRATERSTIEQGALLIDTDTPLACPASAFRLNERLRIQKGMFLVPGRVDQSFEENLRALNGWRDADHVCKVIIPARLVAEGLVWTFQQNLSRSSLFPGLDGYAQSLKVFHPSFRPAQMAWYPPLEAFRNT